MTLMGESGSEFSNGRAKKRNPHGPGDRLGIDHTDKCGAAWQLDGIKDSHGKLRCESKDLKVIPTLFQVVFLASQLVTIVASVKFRFWVCA
jgi:hypothetical protein